MKLAFDEIESVKYLVQTYSDLWHKSNEYVRRLEQLTIERESLIRDIEELDDQMSNVKEQEKNLQDRLNNKYGPFRLDMETFEITPTE
jgi:hypothetical protein